MIGNASNRFGYDDQQIDERMQGTAFAPISEHEDPAPEAEPDTLGLRGLSDADVPETPAVTIQ